MVVALRRFIAARKVPNARLATASTRRRATPGGFLRRQSV